MGDDRRRDATPSGTQLAGIWLGACLSALAQAGRDKLTFVITPTLPGLGLWLEQLVAESTGKHGTGILPVADEPLGDPADYGEDRVFAYLPDVGAHEPELDARAKALQAAGTRWSRSRPAARPISAACSCSPSSPSPSPAGGSGSTPSTSPTCSRRRTPRTGSSRSTSSTGSFRPSLPRISSGVRSLLLDSGPPEYVAMMGYLQPSEAFDAALAELREAIRHATRATTTFGYGPRFLHSTGQFHKGGPRTGRFLQLLHDGPEDVAIPGAPYTFTTLKKPRRSAT